MRPRVLVNVAPSLDGKLAPTRWHAPFIMSRHPEDARRMRALRARVDAVLIGATNLGVDDPDLAPSPLRVVVTRMGEQVFPTAKMFQPTPGGEAVVAHAATMPPDKRAALRPHATLVELGSKEVDVLQLLEWLGRERRCQVVVSEGGGELNAALFAARAVDELHVTLVPRILGGKNGPTMVGGESLALRHVPDASLVSCEPVGDELFLVYAFRW